MGQSGSLIKSTDRPDLEDWIVDLGEYEKVKKGN